MFASLARFTYKNYGVSIQELKTLPPNDIFNYLDLMNIESDYEMADYLDNKPKE